MTKTSKDMTKGNPVKIILLFSIPLLIGNIFQQFYSMIDTIIVGRTLGVDALAAVGSTGSLAFLVNGFVLGLTAGFGVLISQKFGAKNEEGLKKAFSSSIILSIIFTIIITIVSVVFARKILEIMNTPDNIFEMSYSYIIVIFGGIFTTVLYNLMASILRSLGDSKTPLYFLMLGTVLNVVLDFVFILNFKMGVAGAAYATIVAQAVAGVLCVIYTYKKFKIFRLKKEDFDVPKSYYSKHLKVAVPMAIQYSIIAIGIMIVQTALNKLGSTAIAAYTAASKVLQLVMQPSISFGVTMATFTGQNIGAKNFSRIKEGVKKCVQISLILSLLSGICLIVFGEPLVKIFIENPDAQVIAYAKEVLTWSAVFFIPLGFIFIYRSTLQGMGDSLIPMISGISELVGRCLVSFILPGIIGFTGVCLADPVAWIVGATPLIFAYYKRINKLLKENENNEISNEVLTEI